MNPAGPTIETGHNAPDPLCMTLAPSRDANPFATCWTRPGAIPFQFPDGLSASLLVERLAAQDWRGAIVGPHGSGKSTLLKSLEPTLRAAGLPVRVVALRNLQRRILPRRLSWLSKRRAMLIIDGYEQLGWIERLLLSYRCWRTKCGLLVTTHSPTNVPTLIRLTPDQELVIKLAADLMAQTSAPLSPADVAASYACHGQNLREVFFDLYDRHEKLRRAPRPSAATRAKCTSKNE